MDLDAVKLGESLGLGGLLAAGMFWFYRQDSIAARQRLEQLLADYHVLLDRLLTHTQQQKEPRP